jgi:hypothetical protein
VVDPGLIDGQRVEMFNIAVIKALIAPPAAPTGSQKPKG